VLRHRAAAAACACLTVDADAAAAYCKLEGVAHGFMHNNCPNSRGFTKGIFLTCFSTIVDYYFLTQKNSFSTMCTIRSYSIGEGFD